MTSIVQSQPPVLGENHHYFFQPPLDAECSVRWRIDRLDAAEDGEDGGLKVLQMERTMLVVKVTGDTEGTSVSAVVQCPGEEPEYLEFVLGATLAELLDELDTLPDLPPDSGLDLDTVTFNAWPWPYSRRLAGQCPDGGRCTGGAVLSLFPPSIWPVYYTIICVCDGRTMRWDLSFGIKLKGPY